MIEESAVRCLTSLFVLETAIRERASRLRAMASMISVGSSVKTSGDMAGGGVGVLGGFGWMRRLETVARRG